jgi:cystathionine beta-lyase
MEFDKYFPRENMNSAKWNQEVCKNHLIPLTVADMDFRCAEPICQELNRMIGQGIYGYTYRDEEYYESIIKWERRRHNLEILKSNIVPGFGVVPSIHAAIKTLSKRGDTVLIHTPAYDAFFSSITMHKRIILGSKLVYNEKKQQYEIDFQDMEKALSNSKILLLCSPHNPTGRVWCEDELERIAKLCRKYDVSVISDEIHCDLIMTRRRHISFLNIAKKYGVKAVVCGSPTKTFNLAGLNISYCLTLDSEIKVKIETEIYKTGFYHNNMVGLTALKAAFTKCDLWLDNLIKYLRDNRDFVYNYFADDREKLNVIKSEGTYLMLMKFRDYKSQDIVKIFAEQLNLAVNDGQNYCCEEGVIRINIACLRQQLVSAMKKIKLFIS